MFLFSHIAPFAGYLGDKASPRWIMILGGLVASGGVFFTGFVPSLNWAIVSYGLIAGRCYSDLYLGTTSLIYSVVQVKIDQEKNNPPKYIHSH